MDSYYDQQAGIFRPISGSNASPDTNVSMASQGQWNQPGAMTSSFDLSPGGQQTADVYRQTYTDPSGVNYSRNAQSWGGASPQFGGAWTDPTGVNITDPAAYAKMRGLQQQGADFSVYQNQLNQLLQNPSSVTQTPGYQFALQQGNEAINRSAAAKGMLNSGNVLAELAKYGQGMASQGYQQQLNNLQSLMQGSQQFGAQTGYYANPQGSTWYGGQRSTGLAGAQPPAPQSGIWSTM